MGSTTGRAPPNLKLPSLREHRCQQIGNDMLACFNCRTVRRKIGWGQMENSGMSASWSDHLQKLAS
eukprot:6264909-Amphidinium_carterae.1